MNQKENNTSPKHSTGDFLKFLIPSILGAALFLIPFPNGESFTVSIGIIIDKLSGLLGSEVLSAFALVMVSFSALGAILYRIFEKKIKSDILKTLFKTSIPYLVFRIVGAVFVVMTYFQLGPEMFWSAGTGGTMQGLLNTLIVNFLVCGLLLPLLIDFGSMDYVGILIQRVMRPLFTLPGRSSLDCLASFVGNGTVGIVITSKQYDEGYYTGREASVIATCFSIVSIPFCLVIAEFLSVDAYFFPMYFTVTITCIILAIITPRIYPLRKISNEYHERVGKQIVEDVPHGAKLHQWAVQKGVERAAKNKSWSKVAQKGLVTALDIWLTLLPVVMFGGVVALIVAEYTPFFTIISYPFAAFLELLQIPQAAQAAPGIVAGFADMFLPAILGADIESEMTRFFIACVSLCQLIFFTENVMIILKSDIPLKFINLIVIFLERTLVSILVAAAAAHILF